MNTSKTANSLKLKSNISRGEAHHRMKMSIEAYSARSGQRVSSEKKENTMAVRNFHLPQKFKFNQVDENSLLHLSDPKITASVSLDRLKVELKKQENILKGLALEHALHYLFPKMFEKNEQRPYNLILQAVQNASPDSVDRRVYPYIAQRIRHVNDWLRNFVSFSDIELTWETPKFIYLPDGIPMPGKKDMHIVCPLFKGQGFRTEPALRTTQSKKKYLLATIDLTDYPFNQSKFSESYVRNLTMALQQHIDENPEKIAGASFIFSGMPSESLLKWFCGTEGSAESKSTDQSPIPDVEVIYAIPPSANNIPYLFTLKPSRTNYRLKKSNRTHHPVIFNQVEQTLVTERVRLIIDELIVKAAKETEHYEIFKAIFWRDFEISLNPYQTLLLPTAADLEKTKEALKIDLENKLLNYSRILILSEKESIPKAIPLSTIVLQKSHQHLTAHWEGKSVTERNAVQQHTFSISEVPSIMDKLDRLPTSLKTSTDSTLIQEIVSKYNCAQHFDFELTDTILEKAKKW